MHAKLALDLVVATIALIIASPVMLLVALILKIRGEDVFFEQERVGRHGQTFRILKDPRLTDVTQADLEAQFELAMRVHARFDDAISAVLRIREIRAQIDDRIQGVEDRRLTREGEALKATLLALEGAIYEYRVEAQSDLKHFGSKLTSDLSHLKAVIMSADARPTEQSYEVYEDISSELAEQLSRLERVLVEDLGSFDVLLRERNLTPIGRIIT